jgi:hypothetical protein
LFSSASVEILFSFSLWCAFKVPSCLISTQDFFSAPSLCVLAGDFSVLIFLPMCRRAGWRFCSPILEAALFYSFSASICATFHKHTAAAFLGCVRSEIFAAVRVLILQPGHLSRETDFKARSLFSVRFCLAHE